ncbi:MAG TPA: FlgO family outer membrane protein, partial [Xanthomonadales bacterium]|nr:FlgO family outer membrane protein [Xanthomonadales bacterium]
MNLFRELKRRNVFRVGLAYLVGAWLIAQVIQLAADSFAAPDWIMKMLIVVLILGFPAIIFFSWAYELTPDGLKRESELALSETVSHETARRLDYLTITLVVLAVVFVSWTRQSPVAGVGAPSAAGETPAPTESQALTTDRSIAVLPFVNMSDDPENEYFADGLSEELLNRLAQLPELRVAGRTSAFEYKGRNLDLREIAKNLGVSNILEGSVRRSDDRVRITAQLIRASDGSHLWSQSYDRTIDD